MNRHNYSDDIQACATIARSTFDGFERTARVAMLSARKQFKIVGAVVRDVEEHGTGSHWLSSAQCRGMDYLASPKGRALWDILANDKEIRGTPRYALAYACQVPALGLAKGGFLCQMMGIDVGCLDTHSIDKYDIPRARVRLRKEQSARVQGRAIIAYTELCANLGGSVRLWGAWCEYLATLYPDVYANGRTVSELHVTYCKGT